MIKNNELILNQEKEYGNLFYREIIAMEYYVDTSEKEAYLLLTFILTTKSENNKFKVTISYEGIKDYKFKNTDSSIYLTEELWIIDNTDKGWENNYKYHVFDPDCDGEPYNHIDFYCSKIEITSVLKIL